jgi:hypothetical protein
LIQGLKFKESISYNLILYLITTQYKHTIELAETLINRQPERYYRYINEDTKTTLNTLINISVGSSSNSETINTSDKTKSGSDSDSSSILSSSVAATKNSSIESKDKSDKDMEIKVDNMSLNN